MSTMDPKPAARRTSRRDRRRTLALVTEARRRLDYGPARERGRAWINGREVGGVTARFEHLGRSYD